MNYYKKCMSLFIESIKYADNSFLRLDLHQQRINKVFEEYFPFEKPFQLTNIPLLHLYNKPGVFKCRIVFDTRVRNIELLPYKRKNISSLQLTYASIPVCTGKPENRLQLDEAFSERKQCDDIIIVREGYLTDSYYANIALWDGKKWVTPTLPIIYGVQRQWLLNNHLIVEKQIHVNDIDQYSKIRLFNAMIEFGETELDINRIFSK